MRVPCSSTPTPTLVRVRVLHAHKAYSIESAKWDFRRCLLHLIPVITGIKSTVLLKPPAGFLR